MALFTLTSLHAQTTQTMPKLVVAITIDQLRGDYLELFGHTFGEDGFKRLQNGGLVYTDMQFDFPSLDKASTITTLFTGANPSHHGIVAEKRYNPKEKNEISIYSDDNYSGYSTSTRLSPLAIRTSTITDELKIASGGQSDVFAFAPHASQALASGGHAANGAFWIDDVSGNWATTTFYKQKQPVIEQQNRGSESLSKRIGQFSWRPALDVKKFNAFPYTKNLYNFQHFFGSDKKNSIRLFKQSPMVNGEIFDLAKKVLKSNSLGTRLNPDFLALTLYAGNYENALDKNYSVEIQDIYYQLDKQLADFIDTIDKSVGLNNTLILVVSTGYFNEQEIIPADMTTSAGNFYPDRSVSLLNMYLMALYGRHQWVSKYYDSQLFFDHKLIEDRKVDFIEMQRKSAEFLVQSAGIQDVITSYQMMHGAYNGNTQRYRNGYYKEISGDLFIELQPGWNIVEENSTQKEERVRNNAINAPVFFFGNGIPAKRIDRTIDATDIAPTISHRLRIRAPNAAKAKILKELF